MSEFTGGKWEADAVYGDHYVVFATDNASFALTETIANCFGNEANARLIAQAPDMYRLLQRSFLVMAKAGLDEDLRLKIDECLCHVEEELCPTDEEAWE